MYEAWHVTVTKVIKILIIQKYWLYLEISHDDCVFCALAVKNILLHTDFTKILRYILQRLGFCTMQDTHTVPFRIVRRSRVTDPPDGAEIHVLSRVTLSLASCDKVIIGRNLWNLSLNMPGRNLSSPKFGHVTGHIGVCRSKISAQWSRVTGHAE